MFPRALELINKTNQFNTTGQRWTFAELDDFFGAGGVLLALSVRDRYAVYGLTAIVFCRDEQILQFLMSCRIFGMQIEHAAIALAIAQTRQAGSARVEARTAVTGRNHLSLKLFETLGFTTDDQHIWTLAAGAEAPVPSHIRINDA
jgi:FkbH-like protein